MLWQDYGITLPPVSTDVIVRCPWHRDSSKSLSVNPEHGTYRCHGCGLHGTVATYLVQVRNMALGAAREIEGRLMADRKKSERVGPAALKFFRARTRRALAEIAPFILALPIENPDGSGPLLDIEEPQRLLSVAEGLAPDASTSLRTAVELMGIRVDWTRRRFQVATQHPGMLRALERIGWSGDLALCLRLRFPTGDTASARWPLPGRGRERLRTFSASLSALGISL